MSKDVKWLQRLSTQLEDMQRPKVQAYCDLNGLRVPRKINRRWYAMGKNGEFTAIPFSAYQPDFPGDVDV